jgi:hypothetical protein
MEHTWAKLVRPVLTLFRFGSLLPRGGTGESRVAADQAVLDRETEARCGEHLKRLRKAAKSADLREGISLKGRSREERRRLLSGASL